MIFSNSSGENIEYNFFTIDFFIMKSDEIGDIMFQKQFELYIKLDSMINSKFDDLEPDILSILSRTLLDLDEKIQLYRIELKKRETFKK